jgi:hypothetical protein
MQLNPKENDLEIIRSTLKRDLEMKESEAALSIVTRDQ